MCLMPEGPEEDIGFLVTHHGSESCGRTVSAVSCGPLSPALALTLCSEVVNLDQHAHMAFLLTPEPFPFPPKLLFS